MAFAITDSCVACDACTIACPRHAVIVDADVYSIQPDACDECASLTEMPHCLQVCPADCIGPDTEISTGHNGMNVPLEFPLSRSSRYK